MFKDKLFEAIKTEQNCSLNSICELFLKKIESIPGLAYFAMIVKKDEYTFDPRFTECLIDENYLFLRVACSLKDP